MSTYLGHVDPKFIFSYLQATPELLEAAADRLVNPDRTPDAEPGGEPARPDPQGFFTDRLVRQRQASPHTIAAYRDSLRLLVVYAATRPASSPST